jgi:hypothetical protein
VSVFSVPTQERVQNFLAYDALLAGGLWDAGGSL